MTRTADAAIIRCARKSDLAAIMQVMEKAFDPAYGEAWTYRQMYSLFGLPRTRIVCVGFHDEVVGFHATRLAGANSELLLLAVAPSMQRRGLGKAMIDDWIACARQSAAQNLFLEMRSDNPARLHYRSWGFVECGGHREYYRGTDGITRDAVTMCRSLSFACK